MPVLIDWSLSRFEDGVLTISMSPATAIGGWSIRFSVLQRLGATSGLILKSVSSGYNNLSGINVTNSGNGVFNVNLNSVDTSGLEYGNLAYAVERLSSGSRTVLTEGYLQLLPSSLP